MGNMVMNRRVQRALEGDDSKGAKHVETRIFADHMYTGPLKLGDPNYRGLSKMELDPLITQRLRDNARTSLCQEHVQAFAKCSKDSGLGMWLRCRKHRDALVSCMQRWFEDPDFKERVIEEYLNERSHYRETGIKTKRYDKGSMVPRDENDPPLDSEGRYRPRKPTGWDEAYKDKGLPRWTSYKYD